MAIGAYGSTLLTVKFGVPFWAAIPLGAVLAALMGGLLGAPASRLRGIYLALATLGFLQIVQIVIEEFAEVTGGVRGLIVPKAAHRRRATERVRAFSRRRSGAARWRSGSHAISWLRASGASSMQCASARMLRRRSASRFIA